MPAALLSDRWELMVAAKAVVKMERKREVKLRIVERMFWRGNEVRVCEGWS